MNYVVYEVKNKVNGKTYIGKHQTDNIYDDYLGSGKYLKRAINKYGKDCFEKVVLYVFDNKKEMDDKEAELVNEEYVKDKNTYNLKKGGQGGFDHLISLPKMKNIRIQNLKKGYDILKNNLKDVEFKKIWSKRSSETFQKTHKEGKIKYNTFAGKHHTIEAKNKMKKSHIGKHAGNKNSQYGTCWIYNNIESKKIKKEELDLYLSQGWIKGRKIKL